MKSTLFGSMMFGIPLSLLMTSLTIGASPSYAQAPTPISAVANYTNNQLTITGQNFSPSGVAPKVTLGGHAQSWTSFAKTGGGLHLGNGALSWSRSRS
jgi:hypothetical protein